MKISIWLVRRRIGLRRFPLSNPLSRSSATPIGLPWLFTSFLGVIPFILVLSASIFSRKMNNINRLSKPLLFLCCIFIFVNGVTRSLAMPSPTQKDWSLGVSPEAERYYKGLASSTVIKCRDGSKKINRSQLNDDFCDCPDGSDESGTSACPNGKFYCKNAGHAPVVLYSSRVNDGICDCCDGSDEYDGKTKCLNTCWEAGKVEREKLRKKISTYHEGVTVRKQQLEQAKLAIAKDEAELSKLRNEEKILKGLVETLKERKEQIEKAEEKERLQKEKEEKERKEAEEPKEKETHAEADESPQNDINDGVGNADQTTQDSAEDHDEAIGETEVNEDSIEEGRPYDGVNEATESSLQNPEQLEKDSTLNGNAGPEDLDENVAEDTGSLSREELGRRVASRWTGEKTDEQKEIPETSLNGDDNLDETLSESNYEEDNGYVSEYDEHKYDDDDDRNEDQASDGVNSHFDPSPVNPDFDEDLDLSGSSSSSWLEKIQKKMKSVLEAINLFKTPVNISEAAAVRKEYDDSSSNLSKLQSKLSSLTVKLKQDFGPEKEFYSFYGQCFESKQNKYVYKVCPFKQATQVEGYSTTRLGRWEKFDDSYRTLKFENGDKCWNGPDRSMKVKLRCGLKNELTDVDEPSRCEYVALLSTPALCLDSKLKELQEKLESLNKVQPQEHDEL